MTFSIQFATVVRDSSNTSYCACEIVLYVPICRYGRKNVSLPVRYIATVAGEVRENLFVVFDMPNFFVSCAGIADMFPSAIQRIVVRTFLGDDCYFFTAISAGESIPDG